MVISLVPRNGTILGGFSMAAWVYRVVVEKFYHFIGDCLDPDELHHSVTSVVAVKI